MLRFLTYPMRAHAHRCAYEEHAGILAARACTGTPNGRCSFAPEASKAVRQLPLHRLHAARATDAGLGQSTLPLDTPP